ncbi:hypothetical protein [Luteimonas sp. e5]
MRRIRKFFAGSTLLALLCLPAVAGAQSAAQCPQLPRGSGLTWEVISHPGLLFCKAVDDAGQQAFTVSISPSSPFRRSRSMRAERITINGQEVFWYRTEIATQPDLLARETSIDLSGGEVAYFNVQADTGEELQRAYEQISALDFGRH